MGRWAWRDGTIILSPTCGEDNGVMMRPLLLRWEPKRAMNGMGAEISLKIKASTYSLRDLPSQNFKPKSMRSKARSKAALKNLTFPPMKHKKGNKQKLK